MVKNKDITYDNMAKNKIQKPFLKWVGGKTQILNDVIQKFPKEMNNYHFYYTAVRNIEHKAVKDLFLEISEAEAGLVDMMDRILQTEEVEIPNWSFSRNFCNEPPDPTPFDPRLAKKKPYVEACNEALDMEWESFKFYLEMSKNIDHEELRHFFKQCACMKGQIIAKIRDLEDKF